jgi:hypothetical protein
VICPICKKHKAKRLCPAKAESICAGCCGSEREVTIDCPSDCVYLIASRQFDNAKKESAGINPPYPGERPSRQFIENNESLILAVVFELGRFASENPQLVDVDAQVSIQAAVETFRTLSSGIYFEKPPEYRLHRELYKQILEAIRKFRKAETEIGGISVVRDSTVFVCLTFIGYLLTIHSNGRPRSRAFLDYVRSQFPSEQFEERSPSGIILP